MPTIQQASRSEHYQKYTQKHNTQASHEQRSDPDGGFTDFNNLFIKCFRCNARQTLFKKKKSQATLSGCSPRTTAGPRAVHALSHTRTPWNKTHTFSTHENTMAFWWLVTQGVLQILKSLTSLYLHIKSTYLKTKQKPGVGEQRSWWWIKDSLSHKT